MYIQGDQRSRRGSPCPATLWLPTIRVAPSDVQYLLQRLHGEIKPCTFWQSSRRSASPARFAVAACGRDHRGAGVPADLDPAGHNSPLPRLIGLRGHRCQHRRRIIQARAEAVGFNPAGPVGHSLNSGALTNGIKPQRPSDQPKATEREPECFDHQIYQCGPR